MFCKTDLFIQVILGKWLSSVSQWSAKGGGWRGLPCRGFLKINLSFRLILILVRILIELGTCVYAECSLAACVTLNLSMANLTFALVLIVAAPTLLTFIKIYNLTFHDCFILFYPNKQRLFRLLV